MLYEVAAQDVTGRESGYEYSVLVGQCEDAVAGMGGANTEVVHPPGAARAHPSFLVEAVISQAAVAMCV